MSEETATPTAETPSGTPATPEVPQIEKPQTPSIDLSAEVEKWKAQARKHEDQAKANLKENERQARLLKQLAEKVGLPLEDEKPDADALTSKLSETQAEANRIKVEFAVYKAASKNGADPDALLDSRSFVNAVEKLNPSDSGFATSVAEAIAAAVEANPKLKIATEKPATKLGTELRGNGNAKNTVTLDEVKVRMRTGDRAWLKANEDAINALTQ